MKQIKIELTFIDDDDHLTHKVFSGNSSHTAEQALEEFDDYLDEILESEENKGKVNESPGFYGI